MSDKPIRDKVYAPVVSTDSKSKEAILSRNTKLIEGQAMTDSQYDTVVERFCGGKTTMLGGLSVAITLLLLSLLYKKRKIRF
jgi:hypothetical protein